MEIKAPRCPFCGAEEIPNFVMLAGQKHACCECPACQSRGPVVAFELKSEPVDIATAPARTAWNTRAATRPISDPALEELRVLLDAATNRGPWKYQLIFPAWDTVRAEILDDTHYISRGHLDPIDAAAIVASVNYLRANIASLASLTARVKEQGEEIERLRGALEKTRTFAVMFLAFDGRDRGTDRMESTLDGLCKLAVEAEKIASSTLAEIEKEPGA